MNIFSRTANREYIFKNGKPNKVYKKKQSINVGSKSDLFDFALNVSSRFVCISMPLILAIGFLQLAWIKSQCVIFFSFFLFDGEFEIREDSKQICKINVKSRRDQKHGIAIIDPRYSRWIRALF